MYGLTISLNIILFIGHNRYAKKAFLKIENKLKNIVFWKFGMGGSHIWVSNWKNERLLLITE